MRAHTVACGRRQAHLQQAYPGLVPLERGWIHRVVASHAFERLWAVPGGLWAVIMRELALAVPLDVTGRRNEHEVLIRLQHACYMDLS